MIGFVLGAVSALALVKLARRRMGYGGCGMRAFHGPLGRGFGPASGRHRWMLRWLFERLGTMPGQERAIGQALERLRDNRAVVRDEFRHTRDDLARAVESGLVDDSSLDDTFARHDRLVAQLRVTWNETLKTIVETLDERQRKELASLLRGGWGGRSPVWA